MTCGCTVLDSWSSGCCGPVHTPLSQVLFGAVLGVGVLLLLVGQVRGDACSFCKGTNSPLAHLPFARPLSLHVCCCAYKPDAVWPLFFISCRVHGSRQLSVLPRSCQCLATPRRDRHQPSNRQKTAMPSQSTVTRVLMRAREQLQRQKAQMSAVRTCRKTHASLCPKNQAAKLGPPGPLLQAWHDLLRLGHCIFWTARKVSLPHLHECQLKSSPSQTPAHVLITHRLTDATHCEVCMHQCAARG